MQIINFSPDNDVQFSFQCTINNNTVFVTIPFNNYSKRYYIKINDSSGDTKVFMPLVASSENYDINLAIPFEPGKLVYRESMSRFEAT